MRVTAELADWSERDRSQTEIVEELENEPLIEALEARDTELAERLAREHTLNLARHVKKYVDYLD